MKKIIITLPFILGFIQLVSQNLIKNYSFEENLGHLSNYVCPGLPPNQIDHCKPFVLSRVAYWDNLAQTPEINTFEHYTGDVCAKLVANVNSGNQHTLVEGIFQTLNFSINKVYKFSMKYKSRDNGLCNIYLTNNLIHNG